MQIGCVCSLLNQYHIDAFNDLHTLLYVGVVVREYNCICTSITLTNTKVVIIFKTYFCPVLLGQYLEENTDREQFTNPSLNTGESIINSKGISIRFSMSRQQWSMRFDETSVWIINVSFLTSTPCLPEISPCMLLFSESSSVCLLGLSPVVSSGTLRRCLVAASARCE